MFPILIFDSGLGGLSIYHALRARLPQADVLYVADKSGFPYGEKSEEEVLSCVLRSLEPLLARNNFSALVIACNTASTLCLPALRAKFTLPIFGTVPAIKPACEQTKTGLVSVLATNGTVKREYTQELLEKFRGNAQVKLVGSQNLASYSEIILNGGLVSDDLLLQEIAPCFVEKGGQRTDQIVLACTHYPLILEHLQRVAPWQVHWVDPAPAIARRVYHILGDLPGNGQFTKIET